MLNAMSGCACANPRNLGVSHNAAKLGDECTYRLLLTPCRRSSLAEAIAASAPLMRERYCSPAVLSRTPCALRSNRRTPTCDSSRATW